MRGEIKDLQLKLATMKQKTDNSALLVKLKEAEDEKKVLAAKIAKLNIQVNQLKQDYERATRKLEGVELGDVSPILPPSLKDKQEQIKRSSAEATDLAAIRREIGFMQEQMVAAKKEHEKVLKQRQEQLIN